MVFEHWRRTFFFVHRLDQTESGKTIKDENADETKSSDAEEIPGLDLKKVEKAEPFKRRPRPLLALSPMLEEIPEEKGGKDANGKQNRSEPASKKGRQARKHGSVLSPPGLSEDVIYESPEGRDSPKTDKSDKSETGYCSQSSDMLSPTELSLEDMTQDNQELRTAEAFKTSRVFDIFTADKTGDTNRSRSDPISGMTNNQAKLIKESVSERDVPTKWTSNSEPNLASSQPALPNDPRAVSVQEVATESQEKPVKGHARKSSAGSPEALKSSSATTFDTEVSNQRTDSQRSYASTPESPVPAPMQPKPKKVKPVSCEFIFFFSLCFLSLAILEFCWYFLKPLFVYGLIRTYLLDLFLVRLDLVESDSTW